MPTRIPFDRIDFIRDVGEPFFNKTGIYGENQMTDTTSKEYLRKATAADLARIAEIVIFNYRLNFYPIFKNDAYYFGALQVPALMKQYESLVDQMWVYDDGVVKGVVQVKNGEVRKLFVEPILHSQAIGSILLNFAITRHGASTLWALEKNVRAIRFYERHGFRMTADRKPEEDTAEYLVRMERT